MIVFLESLSPIDYVDLSGIVATITFEGMTESQPIPSVIWVTYIDCDIPSFHEKAHYISAEEARDRAVFLAAQWVYAWKR